MEMLMKEHHFLGAILRGRFIFFSIVFSRFMATNCISTSRVHSKYVLLDMSMAMNSSFVRFHNAVTTILQEKI